MFGTQKPPLGAILDTSNPLSRGLVGCWLMNEGGGLRVNDLTKKYKSPGVLTNGSKFSNGGIYQSVATQYITLGYVPHFDNVTQFSYSFEYIANTAEPGQKYVFFKQSGGANRIGAAVWSNYWYIYVGNGADSYAYFQVPSLKKIRITVCYKGFDTDENRVKIYVNGISIAYYKNGSFPTTTSDLSSLEFVLGNYIYKNSGLVGTLFDFRMWNRALSTNEVRDLYVTPYRQFIIPRRRTYFSSTTIIDQEQMTGSSSSASSGSCAAQLRLPNIGASVASSSGSCADTLRAFNTGNSVSISSSACANRLYALRSASGSAYSTSLCYDKLIIITAGQSAGLAQGSLNNALLLRCSGQSLSFSEGSTATKLVQHADASSSSSSAGGAVVTFRPAFGGQSSSMSAGSVGALLRLTVEASSSAVSVDSVLCYLNFLTSGSGESVSTQYCDSLLRAYVAGQSDSVSSGQHVGVALGSVTCTTIVSILFNGRQRVAFRQPYVLDGKMFTVSFTAVETTVPRASVDVRTF